MKNSVLDDLKFLKDEFPELLEKSLQTTRWFKCPSCGDQFAYRKLLQAHIKLSACSKEGNK